MISILTLSLANPRERVPHVRQFLSVPWDCVPPIYPRGCPWVPPLEMDIRRMLDPRRHPFYRHSQAAFFLALDDRGRPAGRLAVLDNRRYNEYNHEQTAFFYLFECQNDVSLAQALFEAGADWARARGLNRMFGPKGFTALDGMGLLVKGFQHRPALGIPYNPPYYPALLEAAGFAPLPDVVSGYLDARAPFPDKIHQLADRVKQRRGLRVARFRSRRDLRAIAPSLQSLYNAAIVGTPGNVPLTDDEVKTIADQMTTFADPRLIKIVLKDDDPVGFLFAYPDISAALQRTHGRLFPFGWADILIEFRRTRWVNLNGAGMIEKYRGLGGTAILFSEMHKSIVEGGFEHADLVQIGADNDKMQRELRDLGVDFYKTHRMYQRML